MKIIKEARNQIQTFAVGGVFGFIVAYTDSIFVGPAVIVGKKTHEIFTDYICVLCDNIVMWPVFVASILIYGSLFVLIRKLFLYVKSLK